MRLSICMMVKNEAHNLHRCLESLKVLRESIDSELIIVDTGSEDETVEIAKQYTEKVYFRPWNNDFAEMRNITISYATGEWLFIIDADEVLSEDAGIIQFLKENNKKFVAAAIRLFNIIDSKGTVGPTLNTMRLFLRTKDFKYESRIHNTPIVNGKVKEITGTLTHYGYVSDDLELMDRKFQRTSKILLEELEKDPNNVYYKFQLGSTYDMHNDLELSVKAYGEAFETVIREGYDWKEYLYILGPYVKVLTSSNNFEEAKKISDFGLSVEPDYLDLIYFGAISCLKIDRVDEGIKRSIQFLDKLSNIKKLPIYSNPSIQLYTLGSKSECLYNLSYAYKLKSDFVRMSECAHLVIMSERKDSPLYGGAVALAIEADIYIGNSKGILELYDNVGKNNWPQLDELIAIHTEREESNLKWNDLKWISKTPYLLGDLYRAVTEDVFRINSDIEFLIEYGLEHNVCMTLEVALKSSIGLSAVISRLNNEKLMNLIGRVDERSSEFEKLTQERIVIIADSDRYMEVFEGYILSKYLMFKAMGSVNDLNRFDSFISSGMKLLSKKYTVEFLHSFDYLRMASQEEWFLINIWQLRNKRENLEVIIKSAIEIMPEWQGVFIKWLDHQMKLSEEVTEEMKMLEEALKKEVEKLMREGYYAEALEIIHEALVIMPNTISLIALKSDITIMMSLDQIRK